MNLTYSSYLEAEDYQHLLDIVREFKRQMSEHEQKALNLLQGETSSLTNEEMKFFSSQIVSYFNYQPASESFRSKVKSRYHSEPQVNFTLQNFLTWHFIDHILVTYLSDETRFNTFEELAVTDFDRLQVSVLKTLVSQAPTLTMDQIRFLYFKSLGEAVISTMFFKELHEEELAELIATLMFEKKRSLSSDEIYKLQAFFHLLPMPLFMSYKLYLEKERSKYGAVPSKLNVGEIEELFYREQTEGLPTLKVGKVQIRSIQNLSEVSAYFENRPNVKYLLSHEDIKLKAAYIEDEMVGIAGVLNNKVANVHVCGDYRRQGIACALLSAFVEEYRVLNIIPVGDALAFVKTVSCFNSKTNLGVITVDTLASNKNRLVQPKLKAYQLRIELSDEKLPSFVAPHLLEFAENHYSVDELETRVAYFENKPVGCLMIHPVKREIVTLYVDPDYRRRGVGSQLVERLSGNKVWRLETSDTGAPFWNLKATLASDGRLYYSRSPKLIQSYLKKEGLIAETLPVMYLR